MTGRTQPEFIVSRDGRAVELRVQGETVFTFLSRDALEAFLDRGQAAAAIIPVEPEPSPAEPGQ